MLWKMCTDLKYRNFCEANNYSTHHYDEVAYEEDLEESKLLLMVVQGLHSTHMRLIPTAAESHGDQRNLDP